jgi:hypothetical protein
VNQIETLNESEGIARIRRHLTVLPDDTVEITAVWMWDILAAYDAIVAERDAAVRDVQVVREIRARRNVVVEVSPELLKNGAFTDQPLHIMLTENGDGTHLLTFRVSDTIRELRQQLDASQRFSDEAVRAHTECYRRLRKAWVRLAACEKTVEAAEAYIAVVDPVKCESYFEYKDAQVTMIAAVRGYRAAVAAETCARSAPITVGDTQGETCAKCGGSGYAIDTERSGVGRVVGKKCDCGSVAYITNGTPTLHAGGTDA